MALEIQNIDNFLNAIHSRSKVSQYTHDFYRYPARFSPEFARWVIKSFTQPGDLVIDPFMGGGTSIVEAQLLGRNAVGSDVSSLATFLAQTKTQVVEKEKILNFENWALNKIEQLNCHKSNSRPRKWVDSGYQRNINTRQTWPIRKIIEQALQYIDEINDIRIERYYRCALLKTGQWALDSRKEIPSASDFRIKFKESIQEICESAITFADEVNRINRNFASSDSPKTICLNNSAEELKHIDLFKDKKPKLVLTSPPYPGVHILYHRWQVLGRRETPAPFWIANSLDGEGGSFYTLGSRHQEGLKDYFVNIENIFKAISEISDPDTIIVQLISFSEPEWQIDKYLSIMNKAGFEEKKIKNFDDVQNDRIWREVPNRKWYVSQKDDISSSREVVLFHKLSSKLSK